MLRLNCRVLILGVWLLTMTDCFAGAATVTAEELAEARRWVAAKFEGASEAKSVEPGLVVLANNDPVQLNSRAGKPMRIVDKE